MTPLRSGRSPAAPLEASSFLWKGGSLPGSELPSEPRHRHSLLSCSFVGSGGWSVAQSGLTLCSPCTAARQASLSFTTSRSLLKLMSTEKVMPSNHLILSCPLLLLPSVFPSIRVFSKESVLHIRWLKYWSFSFSISPSNEYSELISFRMDWFELLAAQGTLKSLLQHRSSKASILQHTGQKHQFFSCKSGIIP